MSAQEPRILSALSGDEILLKNLAEDKDVYATIGIGVYKNDYWDNMEHFPDGTKNVEGDKRRKKCKTLFLGIAYGMGNGLIAERMGVTFKEAKTILDDFYSGFPKVATWKKQVEENARKLGYSEDFWGRRRRLPNILLPKYEYKSISCSDFNPILNCNGTVTPIDLKTVENIQTKLNTAKSFDDRNKIIKEAESQNIKVIDNSGKISQAERQSVNSTIQGSAATMTKKAMISIYNDDEMKRLGFKLLIAVHDELIGECPVENAEEVGKRLTYLMSNCVPELPVKFKCDEEIETRWNQNKYISAIKDEYKTLQKTISSENALLEIYKNHSEFSKVDINEFLFGGNY